MVAKRALVLGLGASGRAAAKLLDALGVAPFVTDDRGIDDETLGELPRQAVPITAAEVPAVLASVERVVVSPGVSAAHPLLAAARERGVPVHSELELAASAIDAPMLAVTGTNGKSTTVALLGRMLEEGGRRTFTGGNLGRPLSRAAFEAIDVCVVEVSSFQLEWVEAFRPRVAAVLNVSADHLDRHGSMDAYVRTKLRLFARMTRDDAIVLGHNQGWWSEFAVARHDSLSTFGRWPPTPALRPATGYEQRARVLRTTRQDVIALGGRWPMAPHDFDNAAAAAEIARRAGVDTRAIERALARFRPLPHRLCLVGVSGGVAYWNDSKATNVGAVLASLEAFDQPVILMAGGVAKGADLAALGAAREKIRLVVAYGKAAPAIETALAGRVPVVRASGFDLAFAAASGNARPGDIVLLAPACASFDEFTGYDARGRRFAELFEALAEGGGDVEG